MYIKSNKFFINSIKSIRSESDLFRFENTFLLKILNYVHFNYSNVTFTRII